MLPLPFVCISIIVEFLLIPIQSSLCLISKFCETMETAVTEVGYTLMFVLIKE